MDSRVLSCIAVNFNPIIIAIENTDPVIYIFQPVSLRFLIYGLFFFIPCKARPVIRNRQYQFFPLFPDKYTQYAAAIPLFIYSVLQGIFNQRLQDIAYYLTRPAFLTDFIFRIKAVIMQSQLDADIALGI